MPDPNNKLNFKDNIMSADGRTWAMKVEEFNVKNGYYAPQVIQHPSARIKLLRLRLMMEELGELSKAMHEDNMAEVADGLADLLYVTVGTAVEYGLGPILECLFNEVHRSNMTKFCGEEVDFSQPPRTIYPGHHGQIEADDTVNDKYSGKVRKGGNYDPPQIQRILDEHWATWRRSLENRETSI